MLSAWHDNQPTAVLFPPSPSQIIMACVLMLGPPGWGRRAEEEGMGNNHRQLLTYQAQESKGLGAH